MNLRRFGPNWLVSHVFLLSLLTGCAALPSREPTAGGFVMRGKLGVRYPEESFSARFLWQQRQDGFAIDLWGPLGQGRVQLTGTARTLELRQGDGTLIDRGPAERVMERHLGWSLPLSVLPHWAQGSPAPGHRVTGRLDDEAGRPVGFEQLGWSVDLGRYQAVAGGVGGADGGSEDGAGAPGPTGSAAAGAADPAEAAGAGAVLPHRITATRGAYRVRLAVSGWEF